MTGRLYGIGVGPGDPELLTLKGARILDQVDVVAYFAKRGRAGNARTTIAARLRPDVIELPMHYPVTTELPRHSSEYEHLLREFYATHEAAIAAHLRAGRDVAVISEGDPLFYGSYMHLHIRLAPHFGAEVIPGVSSMAASWSAAGLPIAQGDDVLLIVPDTLPETELARRFGSAEAVVVMKVGRNLPSIRRALEHAGKLETAWYVERASMGQQRMMRLTEHDGSEAPYFSIVLVPGWAAS